VNLHSHGRLDPARQDGAAWPGGVRPHRTVPRLLTPIPARSGVKAYYGYDTTGGLATVASDRPENPARTVYFERLDFDARGNITKSRQGNGVETAKLYDGASGHLMGISSTKGLRAIQSLSYRFDVLGNLENRADGLQNTTERFQYDTLNRLVQVTTATPSGAGGALSNKTVTIGYDANGNITQRSDVGAYAYGGSSAACAALPFGRAQAGLHAVSAIAGTKTASYCYDANGNTLVGDGRTIGWTAFDMAASITRGTKTAQFTYGPDRARIKRVDMTPQGTTSTLYVGGKAMEIITRPGGGRETKTYIGDFAVVTTAVTASGGVAMGVSTVTQYFHRDHLGSVDVVTDAAGGITQRMSFDAWGKRREATWLPMSDLAIAAFDTTLVSTRGCLFALRRYAVAGATT
jgi:hypothetical protein